VSTVPLTFIYLGASLEPFVHLFARGACLWC
jgi:hypothetical protein